MKTRTYVTKARNGQYRVTVTVPGTLIRVYGRHGWGTAARARAEEEADAIANAVAAAAERAAEIAAYPTSR